MELTKLVARLGSGIINKDLSNISPQKIILEPILPLKNRV